MIKKVINFEAMPTAKDKGSFLAIQEKILEQYRSIEITKEPFILETPEFSPLETPDLIFAVADWLLETTPVELPKKQTRKIKEQPNAEEILRFEFSAQFLVGQLQSLSFSVREQQKTAISLWDNFQKYLQRRLKEDLPGLQILLHILSIIGRETELPISPNLKIAMSEAIFSKFSENKALLQSKASMSPAEINNQFDEQLVQLESSGEMSVFGLAENLISEFQHLPADANVLLIMQHFRSSTAFGYEAATLLVAHPDSKIRNQLISLYESNFTGKEISPIGLRRLIGLRNWLPINERTKLDRLIKKIRQKGGECAPIPEAIKGEQQFYASFRDGVGAQMVWMFSPDNKRKRQFSSILSTFPKGVKDVMVEHEITKSQERLYLTSLGKDVELKKVDICFVQKFIEVGLATNLKQGTIPPVHLLEVAESLGISYWQPNSLNINDVLKELYEKAGEKIHSPAIVKAFLESEIWASKEGEQYKFIRSWLIDEDPVFEDILNKELDKKIRSGKKHIIPFNEVKELALKYLESNRNVWRDCLLWTALLGTHILDKKAAKFPWEVCILTVDQIIKGRPFNEIPLMRGIAHQSSVNLMD